MTTTPPLGEQKLNTSSLHIVILAAGSGTRMRSAIPKILHRILGRPMLQHVIDTAKALNPKQIWLIYGHEGEQIQRAINEPHLAWVEQNPRLGTGHALQVLYPHLAKSLQPQDRVLILSADGPAITANTLHNLIQNAYAPLVLLDVILPDPTGFGRVVRNYHNAVMKIVEHKDANEEQLAIHEIYSGIMMVKFGVLTELLPLLTSENAQKEYYLTQLIELACRRGIEIETILAEDFSEAKGINDRVQLAELERTLQLREAKRLMLQGVTFADPNRFDSRGHLVVEQDVFIDINCIVEGEVFIGTGTKIGANCILKDCHIGPDVEIHPYTFIDGATIDEKASIGPFARIRPGTVIQQDAHIGNFVEVKKTLIGKGVKAGHLSYLGDAHIESRVNIGAGTITCNYDGVNKQMTYIGEGAFIGSNTSLVAPVRIGAHATIGAGSTISHDAPENQLTLSRIKQTTLPHWQRPKKIK